MRGRAIRINPQDNNKISSIWRLTAINAKSYAGWSDFYNLRKRFDTFVGLSEKALSIESGFERMNATAIEVKNNILSETAPITANNRQMQGRYKKLHCFIYPLMVL